MFKRQDNATAHIDTLIGRSARVQGDIEFAGGLHVDGCVTGNVRVVAGGRWIRDDTFEMTWQFVEGPFRDTVRVHFDGPTMTLDREVNVNTGPTARPTIRGIWRT